MDLAVELLLQGEITRDINSGSDIHTRAKNDLNDISISGSYELMAAIVHVGTSVQCGHYYCLIKHDNQWIRLDDERVTIASEPLSLDQAYILFYKRQ